MLTCLLPLALAAPVDLSVDEGIRPPGHARAAQVPPDRLKDVGDARPVRVWWDAEPGAGPAVVEAEVAGRWVVLADDAAPGFTTKPLQPGARVRVRWAGGAPSEPVDVQSGLGPAALAAMAARDLPNGGMPGAEVADVAPVDGGAWVAMLGGGLAYTRADGFELETWGLAEGLPGAQVNAVAVDGALTWVGTDQGLARMRDGQVERVWDEELQDPWVQALHPISDPVAPGVWAGTYRGLSRVRSGVEPVLGPWSVFALEAGSDGRTWAGYEGLRGLPDGEPIEGVDPELNVWDIDLFNPRTYLATDTEGVLRLEEGLLTSWWSPDGGAVYALERVGGRLYAAADADGLVALSDVDGPMQTWGRAEGLPSGVVYEVVEGPPGKLWVGTTGGLALAWPEHDVIVPWPVSPAAEGLGLTAVQADTNAALLGSWEGVVAIGDAPRRWRDALALPGPIVEILPQDKALWVVGTWDVWRVERGRVERFPLPAPARTAALAGSDLWVGGSGGIHRFEPRLERFVPGPAVGDVTGLLAHRGQLWIAAGDHVATLEPDGGARHYLQASAPLCMAGAGAGIWIGTARGAELLDPISGEATPIAGLQAPVLGIAPVGARAIAALEGGELIWLPTGLPVERWDAAAGVGAVRAMEIDGEGRLWVLGDRGGFVAAVR